MEKICEKHTTFHSVHTRDKVYFPAAEQTKKPRTVGSEKALFDKWIRKSLGKRRITDLLPLDFTRLSKKILSAGRSPRTVHYVASIILQMWNIAFDNKLVAIQPPRRKTLNLPAIDNERTRAFTIEEAQLFLSEMQKFRNSQKFYLQSVWQYPLVNLLYWYDAVL